jgi:AcrR family transcriptional regulator
MNRRTLRRSYVSPVRLRRAAETRMRVIQCAAELLRKPGGKERYSLDAVARAAGSTRPTIYRQFGSQRKLLEAVFDYLSERAGIAVLDGLKGELNPLAALDSLVEIQCKFLNAEPALQRLYDEASMDPDLAEALQKRLDIGIRAIELIVSRAMPHAEPNRRRDARDAIFTVLSPPTFRYLARGRTAKQVIALMQAMCQFALNL